ncbi:hypothetical protein [Patulibacter minatonensis]|uniref:hypothetical protein n=1 Tax=Patulibacter minatonensis TaxID=298163 RepID=UPI00047E1F7B|nr:hypothetical protein [Patulibacter minatonensis]
MSPHDRLHDQLVAANARLAEQRAAAPAPAGAVGSSDRARPRDARPRPARRRLAVGLATVAALTGGITVASLAVDASGPRSGISASLPGAVTAMADQIAERKGILHVVVGDISYRAPDGATSDDFDDPRLHDEAWVALDGTGWRDRVVDDTGATANDGLQLADGTEQIRRRNGSIGTNTAPRGLSKEARLPRQAWGSFVGAQLMDVGKLKRIGEETLDGVRVVLVSDERLSDERRTVTYAFDEESGALKQVRDRLKLPTGWDETRTTIRTWRIEPDTPALRRTLTTLDRLTSKVK